MPRYENPWPHEDHRMSDIARWKLGKMERDPVHHADDTPVRMVPLDRDTLANLPATGWRAIWLGHASFLLQCARHSLLIDPVFSNYCAPFPFRSMRRLCPPPCAVEDLPKIDAILLTHGHYDHLDLPTLRKFSADTPVFTASGHAPLVRRRTKLRDIHELAWWEHTGILPNITLTATPAQHFTARTPFDRNRAHWCGWHICDGVQSLWHAGDSAWCPGFAEIGASLGPIDLGMIPIGAYNPRAIMRSMHMDPMEAVQAALAARCRKAVAMHWGTFRLTDEPMHEPRHLLRDALHEAMLPGDFFEAVPIGGVIQLPSHSASPSDIGTRH